MMKNPHDFADVVLPSEIAGFDDPHIAWRLASDLTHSLSVFIEDDSDTRNDKIIASLQMAKSLGPQDALEAQLIAQLVSCHNVASDALQRANQWGQKAELRTQALKEAAQFMRLFRDQTKTLMAYRGTARQMMAERRSDEGYGRLRPQEELRRQQDEQRISAAASKTNAQTTTQKTESAHDTA